MKRIVTMTLIPLTLAGGIAGAAWASTSAKGEDSDAGEIQAMQASGMTLNQAIDAALKSKGTAKGDAAMSAAWEQNDDSQVWGYSVEIADTTGKVHEWFVNPSDGSVSQIPADDDHHDGAEGAQGDGDGEKAD